MESEYDLVVIGSGTAAMGAAMRVRTAGWRVAVRNVSMTLRHSGILI